MADYKSSLTFRCREAIDRRSVYIKRYSTQGRSPETIFTAKNSLQRQPFHCSDTVNHFSAKTLNTARLIVLRAIFFKSEYAFLCFN
jgi:hypothetical protein